MDEIIIIGTGGQARETLQIIENINNIEKKLSIKGFVTEDINLLGGSFCNFPVLGQTRWVDNKGYSCIIAIGDGKTRLKVETVLNQSNISYKTVIDPSAININSVVFGQGCIICANTVFTTDIIIGNHVLINTSATIAHQTSIGDFSTISPGVNIAGNVTIGSGTFVGIGASIIQGITIGNNVVIGAGSTVIRDIPDNSTVVGSPARLV